MNALWKFFTKIFTYVVWFAIYNCQLWAINSSANESLKLLPLSSPDSITTESLNSLIFVSCCKQDKNYTTMAESINSHNAGAFIWMGDAIYSKPPYPEGLNAGYKGIGNDYDKIKQYHKFIDGTWDDHDFGINDADGTFEFKEESQKLYLDFLNIPKNNPRRWRKGVYSSHVFGPSTPINKQVKLIFLDTRYNKDKGIFPNMSAVSHSRIMVILNAFLRGFTSFFGVKPHFSGDILGEAQWLWLESQLANSNAVINIIVSSIQIGTSNPVVENWGHYPKSRKRLFELIKEHKPRGVIFLSGDVHYAELIGDQQGIIEATSSGMTHSLKDNLLTSWSFKYFFIPYFSHHRNQLEDFYIDKNFGLLKFNFAEETKDAIVDISIRNENNEVKLNVLQKFNEDEDFEKRYQKLDDLPDIINLLDTKVFLLRATLLLLINFWLIQFFIIGTLIIYTFFMKIFSTFVK